MCIKLVNYWDKYTEMHGQQNVKKLLCLFHKSYTNVKVLPGSVEGNSGEIMQAMHLPAV